MTKLKESKQEQDSKSSYQKAQERTLTRKLALARKRARETAKKQQAELQKVFEEDKLLPNKEVPNQGMMGSSQGYALASAIQVMRQNTKQIIEGDSGTTNYTYAKTDTLRHSCDKPNESNHSFPPEAFDDPSS